MCNNDECGDGIGVEVEVNMGDDVKKQMELSARMNLDDENNDKVAASSILTRMSSSHVALPKRQRASNGDRWLLRRLLRLRDGAGERPGLRLRRPLQRRELLL